MEMEAPASPRSAAIYYWGGDWGGGEDEAHGWFDGGAEGASVSKGEGGHRWADESDDADYANVYDSTFQPRTSFQRRLRPSAVKFTLTLQDDGDADHWMYARDLSVPDLSAALSGDDEEEEADDDLSDSEPVVENVNDFADPEMDGEDFNTIPIIDLSLPEHVYAQQIGDACRNVGFFYIINHGVEGKVMDEVMDKSKKFFELDLETKLEVSNAAGGNSKKGYRGYFEIGGEDLDNKDGTRDLVAEEGSRNATKATGDFKEGYDCGIEVDGDDARGKFFGTNKWPNEKEHRSIMGFCSSLVQYQEALTWLSDKLLLALGRSLNDNPNGGDYVPEDYFISRTRNPMCTLRLLHYPPTKEGASAETQGCGAHTDYGLFTILQQDSIGGLQVRNRNKHWIDAKPLRGSFVINVGDMLSHWTDGQYASTVHRVISPSVSGDRYSVPFFYNPDHDAVVTPLRCVDVDANGKICNNEGRVGKTALEILRSRYEGTFNKSM